MLEPIACWIGAARVKEHASVWSADHVAVRLGKSSFLELVLSSDIQEVGLSLGSLSIKSKPGKTRFLSSSTVVTVATNAKDSPQFPLFLSVLRSLRLEEAFRLDPLYACIPQKENFFCAIHTREENLNLECDKNSQPVSVSSPCQVKSIESISIESRPSLIVETSIDACVPYNEFDAEFSTNEVGNTPKRKRLKLSRAKSLTGQESGSPRSPNLVSKPLWDQTRDSVYFEFHVIPESPIQCLPDIHPVRNLQTDTPVHIQNDRHYEPVKCLEEFESLPIRLPKKNFIQFNTTFDHVAACHTRTDPFKNPSGGTNIIADSVTLTVMNEGNFNTTTGVQQCLDLDSLVGQKTQIMSDGFHDEQMLLSDSSLISKQTQIVSAQIEHVPLDDPILHQPKNLPKTPRMETVSSLEQNLARSPHHSLTNLPNPKTLQVPSPSKSTPLLNRPIFSIRELSNARHKPVTNEEDIPIRSHPNSEEIQQNKVTRNSRHHASDMMLVNEQNDLKPQALRLAINYKVFRQLNGLHSAPLVSSTLHPARNQPRITLPSPPGSSVNPKIQPCKSCARCGRQFTQRGYTKGTNKVPTTEIIVIDSD